MPIIPQGQEQVQANVSSPVPIAGTGDARYAGTQIAEAGSALIKFGEQQLAMKRELDISEGSAKINSAYQQSIEGAKRQAKPDGSDYGQLVQQAVQPQVDDIMNQYGSDRRVKNQLAAYHNRVQGDANTQILITTGQMMEKDNWNRLDDQANLAADRVRENPQNPNLLDAEVANFGATLDKTVKAGAVSADTAQKARDSFYERVAGQRIEGYDRTGDYTAGIKFLRANQETPDLTTDLDPKVAKNLGLIDANRARELTDSGQSYKVPIMTKGTYKLSPSESAVVNGLKPEVKAKWIDYLEKKAEAKTQVNLQDLHQRISAATSLGMSGAPTDPQEWESLMKDVLATPDKQMPAIAKTRLIYQLTAAHAVSERVPEISNTPRSQWANLESKAFGDMKKAFDAGQKIAPISEGDFVRQKNDSELGYQLERQFEDNVKEQNADAAKYVIASDKQAEALYGAALSGTPKDSKAYASYVLNRAKFLEIPGGKLRILPKDRAANDALKLQGTNDSLQASREVNGMEQQWGKYFPQVFNEMAASNKEVAKLKIGLFAPPETRANLFDSIKNEKQIESEFKDRFAGNADFKGTEVRAAIDNTEAGQLSRVYTSTSENSQGLEYSNNLKKAMELQIKRAATRDPSANLSDLAKQAYNDVLGNQFQIVKTQRSSLLVPKQIGGTNIDEKYVQGYLNVYSDSSNLKDLGVAVPPNFKAHPEAFYDYTAKNVKWVMNDNGTGARMMSLDPNTGRFAAVVNGKGKEIAKTFEEMNQADEKTRAEVRGFAGRMFDAAAGTFFKAAGAIGSGDVPYKAPVKSGEAKQ